MMLHVPTVYAMTLMVAALLGFLLISVWFQNREVRAMLWWGTGNLVLALGLWLLTMRGQLPQFYTIAVAFFLIFTAAAMFVKGAVDFNRIRVNPLYLSIGPVLWLVVCQIPEFYGSVTARTVFVSAVVSVTMLACGVVFFVGRAERVMSRWPLIMLFASIGVLFAVRVPLAILYPLEQRATNTVEALQTPWYSTTSAIVLALITAMAFLMLATVKERAELIQKRAAETDPLTGLLNRRAFLEAAEKAFKGRDAALAMLDLDRFKRINDRFGHEIGDDVLVKFAATVRIHQGEGWVIGRLGGEEFAVVANKHAAELHARIDNIRSAFETAAKTIAGAEVEATFSAGIAGGRGRSIRELMRDADKALYLAKACGRNRIVAHDEAVELSVHLEKNAVRKTYAA